MPVQGVQLHHIYRIEKIGAGAPSALFRQLAMLHVDSIHGGIMETLGVDFLASLYRRLSKDNDVLIYVAQRDSKIIGFVAGSANLVASVRKIGLIGLLRLALIVCANMWRPKLLQKVLHTAGYFFRRTAEANDADSMDAADPARSELLAIAVAEQARGEGVGRSLVNALEEGLQHEGGRSRYFVSTNREEIGSNAFYRAAGFTLVGQKPHHDLMLNVYKKELA
jgi:ribosomal protein S18 acetylase RimI-like enzyme